MERYNFLILLYFFRIKFFINMLFYRNRIDMTLFPGNPPIISDEGVL